MDGKKLLTMTSLVALLAFGCGGQELREGQPAPTADCQCEDREARADGAPNEGVPLKVAQRPAEPDEASTAPLTLSAGGTTKLPPPRTDRGRPLMEVLRERRSSRAFSDKQIPAQLLSDLLWATAGVNRPESGKRTAPSARNRQEIEVYVTLPEALLLYEPTAHALKTVAPRDLRAVTGKQPFAATAPVNLVFVADVTKMGETSDEARARYSGADAAYMSQNTYLFCASEGLATVARGWIDREALAEAMGLGEDRIIVLAQTVGYPE